MFRHSIVPSRRRGSVLARPRTMEPNSDRTYAWYRIVRVPSTNEIVAIQGQHGIKTHTNTLTPKSGRRVLNATVSTVRFVPFRPSRAPSGVRVLPRRRGYAHFTSAACDGRDGRRYRSDPVQEVGRCRLRAAGGLIRPPGVGSCPLRTCSSHGSSASILAAGASDAMVDRSYCNDRARYRSEGYAAADTGSSIDLPGSLQPQHMVRRAGEQVPAPVRAVVGSAVRANVADNSRPGTPDSGRSLSPHPLPQPEPVPLLHRARQSGQPRISRMQCFRLLRSRTARERRLTGGRTWRDDPSTAALMFAAFRTVIALHELLWHLTRAAPHVRRRPEGRRRRLGRQEHREYRQRRPRGRPRDVPGESPSDPGRGERGRACRSARRVSSSIRSWCAS